MYHACNWTVRGSVNMSCLCKWTEHAMCACFAKLIIAIVVVVFFYGNVHITDV